MQAYLVEEHSLKGSNPPTFTFKSLVLGAGILSFFACLAVYPITNS